MKEAELRAASIVDTANRNVARLSNDIDELKVRRESLVARLRVLLSTELDLLKAMNQGAMEILDPPPSLGTGKDHLDVDSIVKSIDHDRPSK